MKKQRFTEELNNGAGVRAADVCRKHRFSDVTIYNCNARYGGMEVSEGNV